MDQNANLMIDRRMHDLGGGFTVGRVLPFRKRRMVGPFIFFDHMGPLDLAPGVSRALDVRPHPHIGLSTVTYLYSGAITHRDSLGSEQEIRPGEVNWMTAGKGITHSERLEYARAHGAVMHGIQSWVALPREQEDMDPTFHHLQGNAQLPEIHENGVTGRLIAGSIDGLTAAAVTYSPLFYLHWEMEAGARRSLSAQYSERAVYVARGEVELDGQVLTMGRMRVIDDVEAVQIVARQPSTLMLLGGEPIGERFIFWNFVSSSKDRLEQASEDWRAQRMKLPVGDDQEFIPLPETKA
ncbi:MAG: pirin family protein [Castellaniella sp.]|uniref:pirin family protein n=1 Tax=Castellaniella sp. TaxID=1955812 RepID=UPI00121DDED4|nr:pirin family protein [Castellaniella sp.]TAN29285.1 MAG: pirin family protein [Castellaniella sp.]